MPPAGRGRRRSSNGLLGSPAAIWQLTLYQAAYGNGFGDVLAASQRDAQQAALGLQSHREYDLMQAAAAALAAGTGRGAVHLVLHGRWQGGAVHAGRRGKGRQVSQGLHPSLSLSPGIAIQLVACIVMH